MFSKNTYLHVIQLKLLFLLMLFFSSQASSQTFGERIVKNSPNFGGIMGRFLSNSKKKSGNTYTFEDKKKCELVGVNCADAEANGCEWATASAITGATECWNGNNFSLISLVKKTNGDSESVAAKKPVFESVISKTKYKSSYYLHQSKRTEDEVLSVAEIDYANNSSLFAENGMQLIDGNSVHCNSYKKVNNGEVICKMENQEFKIKLENLKKSQNAFLRVDQLFDSVKIDLCAITLEQVNSGQSSSFIYSRTDFENLGAIQGRSSKQGALEVYKNTMPTGSACRVYPEESSCHKLYLTNEGLECTFNGSLVYKKKIKVSRQALINISKKYIFNGKNDVSVKEVMNAASNKINPTLKIFKPDLFYSATMNYPRQNGNSTAVGFGSN